MRRLRPADLAAFQAYRAMPDVGLYQGWSPMSDAEALHFLERMQRRPLFTPGEWTQLGIAGDKTDLLIGDVGLQLSANNLSAEIGFTLQPSAQGRGIASAAVREALALVRENTPVEDVIGITDRRNLPSVRLLERVGFKYKESRSIAFRGAPCIEDIYVFPTKERS